MINKLLFSGALGFRSPPVWFHAIQLKQPYSKACCHRASACGGLSRCRRGSVGTAAGAFTSPPLPWAPLFLFSIAFFIPLLASSASSARVSGAVNAAQREEQLADAWRTRGLPFRPLDASPLAEFQHGGPAGRALSGD